MGVKRKKTGNRGEKRKSGLTAEKVLSDLRKIDGLMSPEKTTGKFIRPRIHVVG